VRQPGFQMKRLALYRSSHMSRHRSPTIAGSGGREE
jgi:hypothetical protein